MQSDILYFIILEEFFYLRNSSEAAAVQFVDSNPSIFNQLPAREIDSRSPPYKADAESILYLFHL